MKKYDTIFLDRDGTLNPDPGYISSIQDFKFFDFTLTALKELKDICKRFCIISNQSGIGRGLIDIKDLSEIHSYILNFFHENRITFFIFAECRCYPEGTRHAPKIQRPIDRKPARTRHPCVSLKRADIQADLFFSIPDFADATCLYSSHFA